MIKITNQDICRALSEKDGQDWRFGFGWFVLPAPCFYVKGKSVNDVVHEYTTQIPLHIRYLKKINNDDIIEDTFENLDWVEVYKNLFNNKIEEYGKMVERKSFKLENEKIAFTLTLSTRLYDALESIMTKTVEKPEKTKKSDEGRGGK